MSSLDLLRHDLRLLSEFGLNIEPLTEPILSAVESSKRATTLRLIGELSRLSPRDTKLSFVNGAVCLNSDTASGEFCSSVERMMRKLTPWRKGPFSIFGTEIDSEWRSDFKYERLGLKDLSGKRVADVGAGNGYYMFRMLELNPQFIVGFDPTDRYLVQYYSIRALLRHLALPLCFAPLRSDSLAKFPSFFDLTLCLGVLYHHPCAKQLLNELYLSLAPGGTLLLETLYTPEDESILLNGEERYARMKNVYLIPTLADLITLHLEAGFDTPEVIYGDKLSIEEQRTTSFSPGSSLADFLDPNDHNRTTEGFPSPHRAIVRAYKPSKHVNPE